MQPVQAYAFLEGIEMCLPYYLFKDLGFVISVIYLVLDNHLTEVKTFFGFVPYPNYRIESRCRQAV